MAKDKNVTIKFKSDTNNVETGINKIISELNKLSKNMVDDPPKIAGRYTKN